MTSAKTLNGNTQPESVAISFNLVDQPWIPVVDKQGRQKLVSLYDLYAEAESLVDFVLTPAQQIAVVRLLLCITQAALRGPAQDEWFESKDRIRPKVFEYLKT